MLRSSIKTVAGLILCLFSIVQPAFSAVITFEEVTPTQQIDFFTEIGEVSFALQYCNCIGYRPSGIGVWNTTINHNLSESPPNAAYIAYDWGYSISMTSGSRFNFEGANFGMVGGYSFPAAQAVFKGFRDGEQVYFYQMHLPLLNTPGGRPEPGGLPFIDFNWTNIDSLYIQGDQINSGYESMDNFTYSVVPIPPAVWLFGSALGLTGVMRRKVVA